MNKTLRLFFAFCCFAVYCRAQVSDDFSDGNFTVNPAWAGVVDSFTVDNGRLRSNGPQASSNIYLSTANSFIDSTEWNFWLQLDFNPSSTNFVRVYLVSDQSNLSGPLNGYFIQYGAAGTAPDSLVFYRQNGNSITKLFTGLQGCMSSSSVNRVRVKVLRKGNGNWDVYADCSGGNSLVYEGSFTDNAINATAWFGIACRYTTASRYNMYYFDDVVIKKLQPDTILPVVQSVQVLSDTQLLLNFSEAVQQISAELASNYNVSNGVGVPVSAVRESSNASKVQLMLQQPLQSGINYLLQVSGIRDLNGNMMLPQIVPFSYYQPKKYDILIHEFMADPSPVVGLPDVEFVELYNRTAFPIALTGWRFSDPSGSVILPAFVLQPDTFVILCRQDSSVLFQGYGQVLPLPTWPSLNNSSDVLRLHDANGNLIHEVSYSTSWYNNTVKDDGGWTLEMINPNNPCRQAGNWTASMHPTGGTPGRRNSVWDFNGGPPFTAESVNVLNDTTLEILFTETIDDVTAHNTANYVFSNGISGSFVVVKDTANAVKVQVRFSEPILPNVLYSVNIQNVQNCSGTAVTLSTPLLFALPQNPSTYDVVIHELMPDPNPPVSLPDAEYVELYNRSGKTFNLKDWVLTKPGQTGAKLPDYLLLPDSFVLITSTTNAPLFESFGKVLGLSSFPSLTNSSDQILLLDRAANVIHYVAYDDTWYGSSGKKNGGWALEMVDADNPCSGASNWTASVNATGGTPGKRNSVSAVNPDTLMPRLVRAYAEDNNTLIVYFNEPVSIVPASNPANYVVDNGIGSPALALPLPYLYQTVRLEFLQIFLPGQLYTVTISTAITDCNGNAVGISNNTNFALPDTVSENDVVINEILFDPRTFGNDFVELYNRSSKVIDLKELEIAEIDAFDKQSVLEVGDLMPDGYLLFPGEYVAFTQNTENILLNYVVKEPDKLLQNSLPNFPDKEGICVLRKKNSGTIDSFYYNQNFHYSLLDDRNGVSLERIDPNKPTIDKTNWYSAAASVGYATPTYQNSQFAEMGSSNDLIEIEPPVFTPDEDGHKDFAFIRYRFDEPGYTCNVHIYDIQGRLTRQLVKNETLSIEGQYRWDGADDEGRKARMGIYIVFVEIFNLQGRVKRFKKEVVLGASLR